MPSRADEKAEAVARGRGGADTPARRRRARFQIVRGPQQKQRQAAIDGGEMQPLAEFQIELVDDPGDRGRRARPQRLLDRPQGVVAVRGFDQDEALRIEPERGETMAVKAAMVAKAVSGEDEDKFFPPPLRGRVGVIARSPEGATKQSPHPNPPPLAGEGREGALDCFASLAMTMP
jgi:hypothetical protein